MIGFESHFYIGTSKLKENRLYLTQNALVVFSVGKITFKAFAKAGAEWDGLSVPKQFQSIFPRYKEGDNFYNAIGFIHDLIFSKAGKTDDVVPRQISYSEANEFFHEHLNHWLKMEGRGSISAAVLSALACMAVNLPFVKRKHWGNDSLGLSKKCEMWEAEKLYQFVEDLPF